MQQRALIQSPILEELQRKIDTLKADILHVLKAWYELQNTVRPRLLEVYDRHFQTLEIEIQQKTLAASEIGRRVELLSIKHERGEKLTPENIQLVNTFVDKEFESLRKRMSQAFSENNNHESQRLDTQERLDLNEIPQLYRAIVKKLHPDVNSESKEFNQFWQETQEAFTKKNLQKLRALHTVVCSDDLSFTKKFHHDEGCEENALQAEIKDLEIRYERESRNLKRLQSEEPFSIEHQLYDENWIEQQAKKLRHELLKKDHEIEQSHATYHHLTGGTFFYIEQTPEQKAEKIFLDEFLENMYFNGR